MEVRTFLMLIAVLSGAVLIFGLGYIVWHYEE